MRLEWTSVSIFYDNKTMDAIDRVTQKHAFSIKT